MPSWKTAVRFRIRTFLIAVAAIAAVLTWVVVPMWHDYRIPPSSRSVIRRMRRPIVMTGPAPGLMHLLKAARVSSADATAPGIPIHVDPIGMQEVGATLASPVAPPYAGASIRTTLGGSLGGLGLGYYVEDGVLQITSAKTADEAVRARPESARRP